MSMIQANELRIGNWVNYLNEPCQMNLGLFTHDLQPIPLTPEILLVCGFKSGKVKCVTRLVDDINDIDPDDKKKWTYYWDLRVPENNQLEDLQTFCLVQFGKGCDILWKHQMLSVKVTSLHQLQNLYFSLTGTELPITLTHA